MLAGVSPASEGAARYALAESGLGLPPEQPCYDGAEELAWGTPAVVEAAGRSRGWMLDLQKLGVNIVLLGGAARP